MTRDHPVLPFAVALAAIGLFSLMDALMKGASLAVGRLQRAAAAQRVRPRADRAGVARDAARGWPAPRDDAAARRCAAWSPRRWRSRSSGAHPAAAGRRRSRSRSSRRWSRSTSPRSCSASAISQGAIGASLLGLVGVVVIAAAAPGRGGGPTTRLGHRLGARLVAALRLEPRAAAPAGAGRRPVEVATFQTGDRRCSCCCCSRRSRSQLPEPRDLAGDRRCGGAVAGGAMLFAWAYARAETQALAPLEYSGFLWAALFGWLFFAERGDRADAAGAALIVARLLDRRAAQAARADRRLAGRFGAAFRRGSSRAEPDRVPDQPERGAEERGQHQRERHRRSRGAVRCAGLTDLGPCQAFPALPPP